MTVLVPPNTSAVIALPETGWAAQTVQAGRHEFTCRFRPAENDPPIPVYDRFAELANA